MVRGRDSYNWMNRMRAIEAIPTDYAGVLFRSKTEAVIARAFDMAKERTNGRITVCWEYEPAWARTKDGWVPDFFVMTNFYAPKPGRLVLKFLVEFKPAPPTDSYFQVLANRFLEVDCGRMDVGKLCAFGSPFTDVERRLVECDGGKWGKPHGWDCLGLTDEYLSAARRHRFDLRESAA